MKPELLINHFGSVEATAKAFGISKSAVYQWKDPVPERIAYKAQFITGGILQVDPAAYPRAKNTNNDSAETVVA